MEQISIEEKLHERIKELSCLYDISLVLLQKDQKLSEVLLPIGNIMTKAWRFPAIAIVEIQLDAHYLITKELPSEHIKQQQDIIVFGEYAGFIKVYYPAFDEEFRPYHFLSEEQKLLRKISTEISTFYESLLHIENELRLKRTIAHNDRLAILGEMTAGIAHELNTPLGNILGYAELISNNNDERQIKKDIEKIINAAIYSREIVRKLMLFSADMPQQISVVKIRPLILEALSLLEANFRKSGISHIWHADENLTATIDKVQFVQVLLNLLLNALYASPVGSKITIEAHAENENLIMLIADEGNGIPETVKSKIFEPFFTTKPIGEGSGLGLSVVHGIVKSHKGTITAENNSPVGTVFRISFPLHPQS